MKTRLAITLGLAMASGAVAAGPVDGLTQALSGGNGLSGVTNGADTLSGGLSGAPGSGSNALSLGLADTGLAPAGNQTGISTENGGVLLTLDGSGLVSGIEPLLTVGVAPSDDGNGLAALVEAVESDDHGTLSVMLTPDRLQLDTQGTGDDHIDTDRPFPFGLLK